MALQSQLINSRVFYFKKGKKAKRHQICPKATKKELVWSPRIPKDNDLLSNDCLVGYCCVNKYILYEKGFRVCTRYNVVAQSLSCLHKLLSCLVRCICHHCVQSLTLQALWGRWHITMSPKTCKAMSEYYLHLKWNEMKVESLLLLSVQDCFNTSLLNSNTYKRKIYPKWIY